MGGMFALRQKHTLIFVLLCSLFCLGDLNMPESNEFASFAHIMSCDLEPEPSMPATDGENAETTNRHESNGEAIFDFNYLLTASAQEDSAAPWLRPTGPLSNYIQSIDHPPELL